MTSPIDVVLSPTDVVQPDIVFIAQRHRDIIGEAATHGAPDLVVEVLSPGTAAIDRGRKMQAYARATVAEYWIVDADAHVLEVYDLEEACTASPRASNAAHGNRPSSLTS